MILTRGLLNYAVRHPAFLDFHRRRQRWAVFVAHRRAGKTVAAIVDMILRAALSDKAFARYAFISPLRNQAKDIAWSYLRRYSEPFWSAPPNEAELRVTLVNGATIRLYGADNPDALRGPYLDGVVLDEFATMKSTVWSEVVRPMLADRHGWAVFIGTPHGKNEFYRLYTDAVKDPAWHTMILRASESRILGQGELDGMRAQQSEDVYQQELECSWEAAIKGAYYADALRDMETEGRIAQLEIDTAVRVHTAWDLGISDSTAIWFIQAIGRERRLVDYYEGSGVGLDHYAEILYDKRQQHGWKYGEHFLPHDIQVRELSTGKSRLESLRALGIEATIVPECSVMDGINAVRKMLTRTWVDPVRCERGLECLRAYRREYSERLKDWSKAPLHDWASHGADALRYFAVGFDEPAQRVMRREPERPRGSHWSA